MPNERTREDQEFLKNKAALEKALKGFQSRPDGEVTAQGQFQLRNSQFGDQKQGSGLTLEEAVRAATAYRGLIQTNPARRAGDIYDDDIVMEYLGDEVKRAFNAEGRTLLDVQSGELITINRRVLDVDLPNQPQPAVNGEFREVTNIEVNGTSGIQEVKVQKPPRLETLSIETHRVEPIPVEIIARPGLDIGKISRRSFLALSGVAVLWVAKNWIVDPVLDKWEEIFDPETHAARLKAEDEKYQREHALTIDRKYSSGGIQISYPSGDMNKWRFEPSYLATEKYPQYLYKGAGLEIRAGYDGPNVNNGAGTRIVTGIKVRPYVTRDGEVIPKLTSVQPTDVLMNGHKTAPAGTIAHSRPDILECYFPGSKKIYYVSIAPSKDGVSDEFRVIYMDKVANGVAQTDS